ncbi:hypothetical protein POTOM_026167 [Populus tomentosa]|uniref:Uncharacterized protein n=1 Tax=Populus tomentosa TaxID=118781 RepID=A0A8X7ZFE5_POPTO|nr:hypothetical protein POTOM_026167 [Populus tomentosa]
MADPRSVVPYHDPYDSPIDYEHLNFMNDANPSLAGLSSDNEPAPAIPESFSGSANANANILDPNNPYEDPMAWNFYYENLTVQSHEAGPSLQNQGQSSLGPVPYAPFPNASFPNASFPDGQTSNASGRSEEIFLDGRNIAVWPPEPVPFQCTFCQVLREIIHTDGNYTTKLEIHGRMGIICHAILENRDHVTAIHPQYYMFDFCKKSLENVKEFLQKYCDDRRQAGFIMVQDPHSFFYEALCVGYDWTDDLHFDVFHDPSPSNSDLQAGTSTGERQATNHGEGEIETERTTRSNLALQTVFPSPYRRCSEEVALVSHCSEEDMPEIRDDSMATQKDQKHPEAINRPPSTLKFERCRRKGTCTSRNHEASRRNKKCLFWDCEMLSRSI